MPHLLANDSIELDIQLPFEGYQLARFDWTGKIHRIKFRGMQLSGCEDASRRNHIDLGKGLYNEFGITTPLGYNETTIGDWFHKIGIGLLKKKGTEYQFHGEFEVRPARFKTDATGTDIKMTCTSDVYNGYAYVLQKVITLRDQGFEIIYDLENTGSKPIITDEYNHNFIQFAREWNADAFSLDLPFPIQPHRMTEMVNPEGVVVLGVSAFNFKNKPTTPFFFADISGGTSVDAHWILRNHASGITIEERGDFQTDSINLWGAPEVISPELFIKLHIPPGKSYNWSRRYTIRKQV